MPELKTKHVIAPNGTMLIEGLTKEQEQYVQQHGIHMVDVYMKIALAVHGPKHTPQGSKTAVKTAWQHGVPVALALQHKIMEIVEYYSKNTVTLKGLIGFFAQLAGEQFAQSLIQNEIAAGKTIKIELDFPYITGKLFEAGFISAMHGAVAAHEHMNREQSLIVPPTAPSGSNYKH